MKRRAIENDAGVNALHRKDCPQVKSGKTEEEKDRFVPNTNLKPIEKIRSLLTDLLTEKNQKSAVQTAKERLNDGDKKELIDYALNEIAWDILRQQQLEVERKATRMRIEKEGREQTREEGQRQQKQETAIHNFETIEDKCNRLFSQPEQFYGEQATGWVGNRDDRKNFKQWCKKTGKNFDEWVENTRPKVAEKHKDCFEGDWHPNGVWGHCAEKQTKMIMDMIETVKEWTRLEVTTELLSTEFAIGNGHRVTWGEATITDHEQRIHLLTANAVGNIEAAARHQQAIDIIQKNGIRTLKEFTVH